MKLITNGVCLAVLRFRLGRVTIHPPLDEFQIQNITKYMAGKI